MDEILQTVLVAAAQVLTPIVLGAVVVLVQSLVVKIKANMGQDELAFTVALVNQQVKSAEQQGITGAIANEAKAKQAWVLEQAEKALAKKGFNVDLDVVVNIIEAQVWDVFKKGEQPVK